MIKWPAWVVVGALLLTACSARDDKKIPPLSIGTDGQAVAYFPVGKTLCDLLGDGSSCKLAPADGPVQNLENVHNGTPKLGIIRADALHRAWAGQPPFKTGMKKMRVLFTLHEEAVTLVAPGKAGATLFQNAHGKRLNVGPEGSDQERLVADLFAACKNLLSDVVMSRLEAPELLPALRSHTLDGYFDVTGHPNYALAQAALASRLEIVPIEGDCVTALVKAQPYFEPMAIPGKVYRGADQDVTTVGVPFWVVANTEVDNDLVYKVVRKVFENVETLRQSNPVLHGLSPRKMLKSIAVPYHPGALKYYQEKRWFKAS